MRSEVRAEMWRKMLGQVTGMAMMRHPASGGASCAAVRQLINTYTDLAARGEHLFARLLDGQTPKQWAHYPEEDAIDDRNGFQWFYHSHSPEDRPGVAEHGHIHLFARRKRWSRRLRSSAEQAFDALTGATVCAANTRHLLTIGFDARGLPVSLFTVNSWVTGDRMLSARTTADLLDHLTLDTGYPDVDAVIVAIVQLYRQDIRTLLVQRDNTLSAFAGTDVLEQQALEVLSEMPVEIDKKMQEAF